MRKTTKFFFVSLILLFTSMSGFSQSNAQVFGIVRDQNGLPIENVLILVSPIEKTFITNDQGAYKIDVANHKELTFLFRHISFADTTIYLTIKPNEKYNLDLIISSEGKRLGMVDVKAKHNDGYERIDPKIRFNMPSPMGGAESVIKMYAGVSSINELSSQYNVRGGNYDENLIYVNDIQIYRPFLIRSGTQEGLSFVNLDLTKSVKFSAGGFAAKYGDKMSSVMDVEYKTPTKTQGSFSLGLLGATGHIEGVVKNKEKTKDVLTYLIGVRYKSNAYLFRFLETKGEYKPRFFDTQMLLDWKVSDKFSISLLSNFSVNQYIYQPKNRETTFGSLDNPKKFVVYYEGQELDSYQNFLGGLTFTYKPTDYSTYSLIASSYYAKEKETYDILAEYWLKDVEIDLGSETNSIINESTKRGVGSYREHARNSIEAIFSSVDLRAEYNIQNHFISWGAKFQNEIINDNIKEWTMYDSSGYVVPQIFLIPGQPVPLEHISRLLSFGEDNFLRSKNNISTNRITGFVQDQWRIDGDSARFTLNGGVRFHYWDFNNEFTLSPRLGLLFKPRWKQDWSFWIKTGVYYQSPLYRELRRPDGSLNQNIKSQFSYQVLLSSDYEFVIWNRPFKFTSEVYYKYFDRLISYEVDNVRIIYSGENDASGYAYGADMKLSGEFIRGLESWITVSLMKTEQNLYNDFYTDIDGIQREIGFVPRPSDQRFAVNLFFQDHIPGYPQFRVHLNFVFSSGLPFVAPNAPNLLKSFRTPWYRRADLGFSYIFLQGNRDRSRDKVKLSKHINNGAIYLEVFNLLDIANVSSYSWIPDVTGVVYAIPNSLTPRLINLKVAFEF